MNPGDLPAFPVILAVGPSEDVVWSNPGLTKREYFAGQAMKHMLGWIDFPKIPQLACQMADELIKELEKKS